MINWTIFVLQVVACVACGLFGLRLGQKDYDELLKIAEMYKSLCGNILDQNKRLLSRVADLIAQLDEEGQNAEDAENR